MFHMREVENQARLNLAEKQGVVAFGGADWEALAMSLSPWVWNRGVFTL